MRQPGGGSVDIRIGRILVDEAALGEMHRADFAARLREAIAGRIAGDKSLPPHPIADRIADTITARLAMPVAGSGGSGR